MNIADAGPPFSGLTKVEVCRRLGEDWKDLADYLQIGPHEQARFQEGRQAQEIWAWLERRVRLDELRAGLRGIGRHDLVKVLDDDRSDDKPAGPTGPASATRPATGPARQRLPLAALAEITDSLLALGEVADGQSRRQIMLLMPDAVRAAVPEMPNARAHVIAWLRTCESFIGGRAAFVEAMDTGVADRDGLRRSLDVLDRLWPSN